MTLTQAFERVKKEIESITASSGYYGDVKLRIEAGQVVVIDYHRTEK